MDALYFEAVLSDVHAFEAEYSINEDTGSIAEVYTSNSEEETLECESQSDDAFADLSMPLCHEVLEYCATVRKF